MDLNRLHDSLDNGVQFLGKLLETLQNNSTPANVHSSIASAVSITATLTKTATALRVLMASSDQMFSRAEFVELFGRLGEAVADAANNTVSRLDLPEQKRTELRDFIVDEVARLFTDEVTRYEQEITERRRQGISALQIEDQR